MSILKPFPLALALAAVTVAASGAAPMGTAPPAAQAMAAVNQFVDNFNAGNTKAMVAACAPRTNILDDFPPHVWAGSGACATWASALATANKAQGMGGEKVTLLTPTTEMVTGNVAYLVVPATLTFTQHGKAMTQTGATWTLVVQKMSGGWRITAWAWADGWVGADQDGGLGCPARRRARD